ncbi:streptavidin-like [Mya arenaria]|uniref:streptavidin-like n=1 Tax=Mya arenaria TaxID=6604 RepID=UPI0022DFFE07|nr:streptavidin-like [Mya arenaria]
MDCVIRIIAVVVVAATITVPILLRMTNSDEKHDQPTFEEQLCLDAVLEEENECKIAGVWKNQYSSYIRLTCSNGFIVGRYFSGDVNAGFYELAGRYQLPDDQTCILGWIIAYENELYGNSNSTTSFSGIHYQEEEMIRTHWLQTHNHPRDSLWKTTTINHDDYTKVC